MTNPAHSNQATTARTETLRRTLEGRSVYLVGSICPFWRCEYCDAMATSPLLFPHKPGCLLARAPAAERPCPRCGEMRCVDQPDGCRDPACETLKE